MKVLVPIDFSDEAKHALNFALGLQDTDISVIHVIEYPAGGAIDPIGMAITTPYSADFVAMMQENATLKIEEFLAESTHSDKIDRIVEIGNPYTAINEVIVKNDVDLVVMGTKGASGVKEFLIGSNAEKVVRTSKCPVITLSKESHPRDINNIVFATHLFDHPDDLMMHLKQLQEMFHATIHVVHVNTPNNFVRNVTANEALKELVSKAMLKNYSLNIYNDVYEDQGILTFAQEIDADMIAMGTHGRKGLGHLVTGSLAEDVVNHSKRPIWTYRYGK
ncbi:MAG: universal stress protein [Bacteroidota bacterium]